MALAAWCAKRGLDSSGGFFGQHRSLPGYSRSDEFDVLMLQVEQSVAFGARTETLRKISVAHAGCPATYTARFQFALSLLVDLPTGLSQGSVGRAAAAAIPTQLGQSSARSLAVQSAEQVFRRTGSRGSGSGPALLHGWSNWLTLQPGASAAPHRSRPHG